MKKWQAAGVAMLGIMTGCTMADKNVTQGSTSAKGKDVGLGQFDRAKPMEKRIDAKKLPPFKPAKAQEGEGEIGGVGSEGDTGK